jgi:HD superfamily phosphodiesterase
MSFEIIIHNMKEIFQRIWDLAFKYQDKRDDIGHARITLNYAKKLIELENGDEDIVIPSIILHDIGWSQMPAAVIEVIVTPGEFLQQEHIVRRAHEEEGVKLAARILTEVEYPQHKIDEILEIISEHDTRNGFISKNDGLVREADKLWRFSKTGFEADVRRSARSRQKQCQKLTQELAEKDYLFSDSARQCAMEELSKRQSEV